MGSFESVCFFVFIVFSLVISAWYFSPSQKMKRILETAKEYQQITGKPFNECFDDAVSLHNKIENDSKGKLFP